MGCAPPRRPLGVQTRINTDDDRHPKVRLVEFKLEIWVKIDSGTIHIKLISRASIEDSPLMFGIKIGLYARAEQGGAG